MGLERAESMSLEVALVRLCLSYAISIRAPAICIEDKGRFLLGHGILSLMCTIPRTHACLMQVA